MVKYTYKYVPPNGGWGYVIAAGMAIMFTTTVSTSMMFGFIYGDFMKELGDETTGIAMVQSVYGTTICIMGLLTNFILSNRHKRAIGILGATIYFMGAFLTAFVRTLPEIIVTYAVLQGIGYGFFSPVVFQALNEYFTTNKRFVNSLVGAISCGMNSFYPFAFKYLLESYGFRGATMILAGISLHGIFVVLLMQPVEWHMKKQICEQKISIINVPDPTIASPNDLKNNLKNIKEDFDENSKSKSAYYTKIVIKAIVNFFDLTLLKDPRFINIIVGCGLLVVTETNFVPLIPMVLGNRGVDNNDIALIFTWYSFSDLISRICQSVFNRIFQVKSRYLTFCGSISIIIMRLAFAFCTDLSTSTVLLCLMGASRCWVLIPIMLTMAEYDVKRFPGTFGMHLVATSGLFMIVGPFIGWMSELFQSDTITIIILTIIPSVCCLFWTIEFLLDFFKNRSSLSLKRKI